MEKPLYKAFKYRTCSGFVFRIDEKIGNNYSCSVFWMVRGYVHKSCRLKWKILRNNN